MAPKAIYTYDRLAHKARETARLVSVEYGVDGLTCEPVREHDGELRRGADVTFQWRFRHGCYDEFAELAARSNHVMERGAPLPEAWATALRALSLERICTNTQEKIRAQEHRLSDLSCEVLGFPRAAPTGSQGKLIALTVLGERVMYILCAKIVNDDWLVHRGSYKDAGELDETDPFQEKDLVIKNIKKEAWGQTQNRRLRTCAAVNTMRGLVQGGHYTWRRCVAIATYRAEGDSQQKHRYIQCRGCEKRVRKESVPLGCGRGMAKPCCCDILLVLEKHRRY